jgi:cytoskeletal protein CcmA (bactofilin family)
MGTLDQISKWTHEAGEWIWKVAGSPDAKDTPVVNEPPLNSRKEQKMMKLGKPEEKETGYRYESAETPAQSTSEETVIGEHISIEGTVRADEDILIEGTLKGTIEVKSHRLAVGPKGKIEGDVEAENVTVGGKMVGNIMAHNRVHITQFADFTGQIKAKRIAVEDGAYLKATIELERAEPARSATVERTEAIVFDQEEKGKAPVTPDLLKARQAK